MNTGSRRHRLLYVGNDPMLSKATAALLKRMGYAIRVTSPLHASHSVRESTFCGVILCATLSAEETSEVVEALGQAQPDIPIISIHLGLLGDPPHPASSVVVDALKGPEALIHAVESMVGNTPRTAVRAG